MRVRRRDLPLIFAASASAFLSSSRSARARGPQVPPLPRSFKELIEKIDWEPATQGTLLIIGDIANRLKEATNGGDGIGQPLPLPDPQTGRYRPEQIAPFYDCEVVRAGRLSVLAPASMMALNWRNLPKVTLELGASAQTRLHLLFASLQPGQWRKVGSRNGLGPGDLTARQQSLLFSLAPVGSSVDVRMEGRTSEETKSDKASVTPEMQAGMRLRIVRQLDWMFISEDKSVMGGGGMVPQPGEQTFTVRPEGDIFDEQDRRLGRFSGVYGIRLRENIPASLKPGDLLFRSSGLNAAVSLSGVKTVEDLVRRISDATGVELISDLRYAELPVHCFSERARAGDLAEGLCRGVTGAWRQVGSAFVLTHDRVGLALQHIALNAWGKQALAMVKDRDRQIIEAMKKADWQKYIDWDRDDPNTPSEAIRRLAGKGGDPISFDTSPEHLQESEKKLASVKEFPQSVQAMIVRQIQESEANERESAARTVQSPGEERRTPIVWRKDKVMPRAGDRLFFSMPGLGMGNIAGKRGIPLFANPPLLIDNSSGGNTSVEPTAFVMPEWAKMRAVVLRAANREELTRGATAAKRAGFSEFWIDVRPDEGELVKTAVEVAKEQGLTTRVVVRVLRARSEGNRLPVDLNVGGEPLRKALAGFGSAPTNKGNAQPGIIENRIFKDFDDSFERRRQIQLGDWLRCDEEALEELHKAIQRLIVPGIGGLAVRDLSAPGYTGYETYTYGPKIKSAQDGLDMGYSAEMRLAFLRKYQVDPIDISPFRSNNVVPVSFGSGDFMFFDATMPNFADFGPGSQRSLANGIPNSKAGSRGTFERWTTYRADLSNAFQARLLHRLKESCGTTPLLRYFGSDRAESLEFAYFGTVDTISDPEPLPEMPVAPGQPENSEKEAEKARKKSNTVYRCYPYYPGLPPRTISRDFVRSMNQLHLWRTGEWDGLVIDLSTVSIPMAVEALAEIKSSNQTSTTK